MTMGQPVAAGKIVISGFRLRGRDPDGIDRSGRRPTVRRFANATGVDIVVSSNDTSAGWALAASDDMVRFIRPNGTTIPAHGRFTSVNGDGSGLATTRRATTARSRRPRRATDPVKSRETRPARAHAGWPGRSRAQRCSGQPRRQRSHQGQHRLDAVGLRGRRAMPPLCSKGTPLRAGRRRDAGCGAHVYPAATDRRPAGVRSRSRTNFFLVSPRAPTYWPGRAQVARPRTRGVPVDGAGTARFTAKFMGGRSGIRSRPRHRGAERATVVVHGPRAAGPRGRGDHRLPARARRTAPRAPVAPAAISTSSITRHLPASGGTGRGPAGIEFGVVVVSSSRAATGWYSPCGAPCSRGRCSSCRQGRRMGVDAARAVGGGAGAQAGWRRSRASHRAGRGDLLCDQRPRRPAEQDRVDVPRRLGAP